MSSSAFLLPPFLSPPLPSLSSHLPFLSLTLTLLCSYLSFLSLSGNTGTVERLGLGSICLQDGPAGPRPVDLVTVWPAGVTTAATWDRDLIYARSFHMGEEFKGKGVKVALGPVTCVALSLSFLQKHTVTDSSLRSSCSGGPLGRSPLGGRNWEGWAPDLYLNGVASYLGVKGIQDAGVVATAKHFIAYEQDSWRRLNQEKGADGNLTALYQQVNSIVDDKTVSPASLLTFGCSSNKKLPFNHFRCTSSTCPVLLRLSEPVLDPLCRVSLPAHLPLWYDLN